MGLQWFIRTTPRYIKLLEAEWINTPKKFLQRFPRDYEDRSTLKTLDQIVPENTQKIMTKGKIIEKKIIPTRAKKLGQLIFQDEKGNTGTILFTRTMYAFQKIEIDERYTIIGKPKKERSKIIFRHPQMDKANNVEDSGSHTLGRIYPVYPELMGIKPERFAQKMRNVLDKISTYTNEHLPEDFLKKYDLMHVHETLKNIHYPESYQHLIKAQRRVFFDRLLRIQLHSLLHRDDYHLTSILDTDTREPGRDIIKNFIGKLPFELTGAQKKVTKEIIDSLHDPKPMLRLLQGDVGSGKTIVAAIAAYYTHQFFWAQSAFLAPLEILAQQHHANLAKLLLPLWLRVELLTGSLTKSHKEQIKKALKEWHVDLIVGTHAVIQEDVDFKKLHLAVIDEQHKFWVKQRWFLKQFGSPHLLQMSATPIPRSMALAFFGEFDTSVIDELPWGRKPIVTKIVQEKEFNKLKPRVLGKINEGQQVFIITPLVTESEHLEDVKDAHTEYEETKSLFHEIDEQVALIHGKMKSEEKQKIMKDFKAGKYKILVATTVIEVGVDIPQATIMIIKNAERFWLSQLHQLRGRIGRNSIQSYCFLETAAKKSSETYQRLKAMEDHTDGFKLAEIDLQHRGAGQLLGTRQSGETDLPIEILSDLQFIETIKKAAQELLTTYPRLEGLPQLKLFLDDTMGDVIA